MKNTALTHLHVMAAARMTEFAGYRMPVEYSGVIHEHHAVRKAAGVFDVSHMGEFRVKGDKALELLQYVTTNDVSSIKVGMAQYTCFPNEKGGIVDDLIIYRYAINEYMLVVNASNIKKDWNWINMHNTMGAELEDASDKISLMALQGPQANQILQQLVSVDLDSIGPFHFTTGKVSGVNDVIISATGYTGAGGFELYCNNEGAPQIWETLLREGRPYGISPAGLAARDTLRLEMGYSLYGNDIDDSTSPIEAGLGWIVKMSENNNFIGKEIFRNQKREGVSRKLVAFEMLERGIPRKGYKLLSIQGSETGKVTSGTMSPSLSKGIGLGYIKAEDANLGNEIMLVVRNKTLKAKIVKIPFLKR